MKKAWIVNNLARQVDGEYCFNYVEYATFTKEKAEQHFVTVKAELAKTLPTPAGDVSVVVERGILEIEIDD